MDKLQELEASRLAMTLVITSLIRTHPNYNEFQLDLTSILEQQMGPLSSTSLMLNLTQEQMEFVRNQVEWIQTTKQISSPEPRQPRDQTPP